MEFAMRPSRLLTVFVALATFAAGAAVAQEKFDGVIKARKGQFELLSLHVGVLGGMARGNAPYDAAAATAAANNIATVTKLSQGSLWPAGSHNATVQGTRAQPNIFENSADFAAKWDTLGKRAAALQAVAGNGLDALRPAVGALGAACQDCHEKYRAPAK